MAGSRSTPPLFDLIRPGAERESEAKPASQVPPPSSPKPAPPPQSRPAPTPAPAPAPSPVVSKPVVRLDAPSRPAPAPAPRAEAAPMPKPQATPQPARARTSESPGRTGSRQSITVNVVWVWLALAGVLAALLGVWSIAYWRGGSEARERLARYEPAETNVPPVAAPKPNVPNKPVPTLDKPVGTSKLPAPAETSPKQGTQTPAAPASDTRQVGFNYLLCASGLEKSAAEGAAGYLTQNGVPAIAVPTSKGGSKYTVYTLLGIPSGSLDDQLKVRNDHKAEVTRLGKQWRKDHPGASDFSDAYWEKYKP